jgi:aminoglycoside phosphotransferase (APT) family kinase protein
MRLLAKGRASEIYDLEDGRVLRRFKGGGNPAFEARVMEHAHAHGFPVPAVHEVREDALVLERIEGRTMLEAIEIERDAAELARLHRQLHEIPFEGVALVWVICAGVGRRSQRRGVRERLRRPLRRLGARSPRRARLPARRPET